MITSKMLTEARKVLEPLDRWHHDCHGASFAIVNAELWTCRVARGMCKNVGSQHSWVVMGTDPYDKEADILDPTLWSYDDEIVGVLASSMENGLHTPHGAGDIWEWGKPSAAVDEPVELAPPNGAWSDDAKLFLELLGPLDWNGWATLANAPVEGWPAGEILSALQQVRPLVGIDIIGMTTNQNPGGTYIANGHEDEFPRFRSGR